MGNIPTPLAAWCLPLTLFEAAVLAGFPSPATDYAQRRINLNEHLLVNEQGSFLFRVSGDSMSGIGMYCGNTLIVDRSITPRHPHIVLAIVDEEFTVKRLYRRGHLVKLLAANPAFAAIVLSNNDDCAVSRSNEARALGVNDGNPRPVLSEPGGVQHRRDVFGSDRRC